VEARAFGLPQRRRRVFLVASQTDDPRTVLFGDDAAELEIADDGKVPCGFYWTEGRGGLGWAVNGLPTLKGGSSIGIPSPPAIWDRARGELSTPDLRDAERLQGFDSDWTAVSVSGRPVRDGHRWKMVGNAVSVPVAMWLGRRLAEPGNFDPVRESPWRRSVWPDAAYGDGNTIRSIAITEYPALLPYQSLDRFLRFPTKPLSAKATAGFLMRAKSGKLRFRDGFLDAVEQHLRTQRSLKAPLSGSLPTAEVDALCG
jgi:DNA (cytosine-5)-methyltransferase 1